jgi:NEDD4-binding protein 2
MKFSKHDKVIVSGNNGEFQIGEFVKYADLDNCTSPIPQVLIDGKELMCFGHVIPYSDEMTERLDKFSPDDQFLLLTYLKDWGNGKKLILMRGLPGSGKSTKAKQLVGNGQIFSTDDYWCMNEKGEYRFNIHKIGEAHKWNQRRSLAAMKAGVPIVVIDNTNTTIKELRSYTKHISLAAQLGYTVSIEEPETAWRFDLEELLKKGTHNVPKKTVQAMLDRYVRDVKVEDVVFMFSHPSTHA